MSRKSELIDWIIFQSHDFNSQTGWVMPDDFAEKCFELVELLNGEYLKLETDNAALRKELKNGKM